MKFLRTLKIFGIIFLCLIFFYDSGCASVRLPLEIIANKIETFNNFRIIIAKGNVVINNKNFLIWADRIEYEVQTEYLILKDFRIFDKKRKIIAKGKKAFLDLRNEELWSDRIFIVLKKQGIKIKAWNFHKDALDEYFAKKAILTTCNMTDCEDEKDFPPWSVELNDFVLTSEGIRAADSTILRVKSIPVLYIPKIAYLPDVSLPIAPPRKTGFLTPIFVQGNRLGFGVQVPFFWTITDQLDFTISPMYLSKRGILWDVENELKTSDRFKSVFRFRYIKDLKKETYLSSEEKVHKWWILGKVDYIPKPNLDTHLDIDLVSEKDFLEEFDVGQGGYTSDKEFFLKRFNRDIEDKSQEYRTSKLWIQYFHNSIYSKIESRYLDYHGALSRDEILQPVFGFQTNLLPFNLYKNLLNSFSFSYLYSTRKEGYYGHRLSSKIELAYPFRTSFLFNEALFRYNFDYYVLDERGTFDRKNIYRKFYEFKLNSYTYFFKDYRFLKVFNKNFEFFHTVKPYISYFYRKKPKETNVPQFTYEDLISDKSNFIEYGLWQFFSFPYHKNLLIIRAYQQYDFTKTERSPTATGPENRALSDLYLQVLINYVPHLNLRYDGSYNFYGLGFKQHSITIGIKDFLVDSANIGYQEDSAWHTRQLTLDLKTTLLNRLQTHFFISRNLINKQTTEMELDTAYLHKCYSIGIGVDVTPKDTKIFFKIELKGLGKYGFVY